MLRCGGGLHGGIGVGSDLRKRWNANAQLRQHLVRRALIQGAIKPVVVQLVPALGGCQRVQPVASEFIGVGMASCRHLIDVGELPCQQRRRQGHRHLSKPLPQAARAVRKAQPAP